MYILEVNLALLYDFFGSWLIAEAVIGFLVWLLGLNMSFKDKIWTFLGWSAFTAAIFSGVYMCQL